MVNDQDFELAKDKFVADTNIISQVANGDENTVVETAAGPLRSLAKLQKDFLGDVADVEKHTNKDTENGYPSLSGFMLVLSSAAGTIKSLFTSAATEVRTWTMPDKDGTVALTSDIPAQTVLSYDVKGYFPGMPDAGAVIYRMVCVRRFYFTKSVYDHLIRAGVTPAGPAAVTINKLAGNGTTTVIGRALFDAGSGKPTMESWNTDTSQFTRGDVKAQFNKGDELFLTAPAVKDTKLANILFSFLANVNNSATEDYK